MTQKYHMTLAPQGLDDAGPEALEVLQKAQRQVGFIPNMYARMVNSPGLLETYLDGYARFREHSGFTPAEQEVVFLTISRANGCDYCMAAHSMIADSMSKVPVEVTDAIRNDQPIPDPRLSALHRFTRHLLDSRGRPDQAEAAAFLTAGYSEVQILEIVLAIAVKTLSNWSNHLFHTPVDEMFAGRTWTMEKEK